MTFSAILKNLNLKWKRLWLLLGKMLGFFKQHNNLVTLLTASVTMKKVAQFFKLPKNVTTAVFT